MLPRLSILALRIDSSPNPACTKGNQTTAIQTVYHKDYIHHRKLTWQWKNNHLKMYLLFKMVILRFQGGKFNDFPIPNQTTMCLLLWKNFNHGAVATSCSCSHACFCWGFLRFLGFWRSVFATKNHPMVRTCWHLSFLRTRSPRHTYNHNQPKCRRSLLGVPQEKVWKSAWNGSRKKLRWFLEQKDGCRKKLNNL